MSIRDVFWFSGEELLGHYGQKSRSPSREGMQFGLISAVAALVAGYKGRYVTFISILSRYICL